MEWSDDSEYLSSDSEENGDNGRQQLVSNLFKLFIQHNWTLKSLEDTAKLMNSIPGAKINLPTTKYLLIKELLNISKIIISYHFRCSSCEKYTKTNAVNRKEVKKCAFCNKELNTDDFFVSFNLKEQIASIINGNFDEIKQFCDTSKNSVNVTDVHNSDHIRNIKKQNENIYSLTVNTDGVAMIKSKLSSLWPVLITCNFLPPQIRFKNKNILVAALYLGAGKPNVQELLRPLAEEFKVLSQGIFVRELYFNLFITIAALDLPAKSDVSKLVLFNSEYSCNFCLQKGDSTSKGIRYMYKSPEPTLRTHESIVKDMLKVNSKRIKTVHGIKAVSPMIAFHHFDLSKGFSIDYMHAVLLGVTKKILGFWILSENHKQPYYINKYRQNILDQRLLKIKTTSYVSRRPRSLKNLKQFKASELRSLLLYFIPVVTEGLLPKKYIQHFLLLSSSIYRLLVRSISITELDEIEQNLKRFVMEYEQYYGKINMTMNIHLLIHLTYCVKNFGPLWAYSMFPFEAYNGLLKSFVVAPTDVLHQITTRYLCYKITEEKDKEVIVPNTLLDEKECTLEPTIIAAIEDADLGTIGIKYYSRFKNNRTVFTSRLYSKAQLTVDYIVETVNGELWAAEMYILCNGQSYAILERLTEIERFHQFKKFHFSKEYHVVRADTIVERCIQFEVLKENFLVKRPNAYERN